MRSRSKMVAVSLSLLWVAGAGQLDAGPIEDPGGLLYHLDADPANIVFNGATVATWNDIGGANNNFVQTDPLRQPLWVPVAINGLPAVQFSGADQELLLNTATQPQTFIAVTNALTGGGLLGIWGGEGQDKGIRLDSVDFYRSSGHNSDGNDFANGNPSGVRVNGAITGAYTVGTPHIIAETRGPNFNATTFNTTSIGEYYPTRDYHGDVAELIVYDHVLTGPELVAVENFLGTKYGIATAGELPPPGTVLGTGTGALRHDGVTYWDLTDPENDGMPDDNLQYNAVFTSTDEPGFGGGEYSFNVFDNRVGGGNDKWCCNDPAPDGHQLTVQFPEAHVIDSFTVTSSNDSPQRDPVDWAILGSNDGVNFTPIFEHSGSALWTARNQVILFQAGVDYATPSAYQYVRYDVQATGGNQHALNELEFFDSSFVGPGPLPGTVLGTGTGALWQNGITRLDLTDPENDGLPDADVNYNATFTSTDEPGFGGGEFSFNVFDNQVGGGNAKWCCNDPGADGHQLTAEFPEPHVITAFTVTSSNDSPGRDPTVWSILGSNDGVNFTPIFEYDGGSLWTQRNEVRLFQAGTDYATPPAYKYVRYDVRDTLTGGHALNELEFFDSSFVAADAFNVRMIQVTGDDINNTTEAIGIAQAATGTGPLSVNGENYDVTVFVNGTTNAVDYAGGGGSFPINYPYPDGRSDPGDDFLVAAQAYLRIPAGTWTIAFGSDDGGVLNLDGMTFDSRFNSNTEDGPDQVRFEGTRGHGWTGGTFTVGGAEAQSELMSLFFERGGGDSYEIAIAPGSQGGLNGNFNLLANNMFGWGVSPTLEGLARRIEIAGDNNLGTDERAGIEQNVTSEPLPGALTVSLRQNLNETIQIAEVQAFQTGTGINVAEQSQGGVATATSAGYSTTPANANDGSTDGNHPNEWHSTEMAGATLTITLAAPTDLDSVQVWGRTDCCYDRQDDFNLIIRDAGDNVLFDQQVLGIGSSPDRNGVIPVGMVAGGEVLAELFPVDTYVFELDDPDAAPGSDQLAVANPLPGVLTTILDANDATLEIELLSDQIEVGDTWTLLVADAFQGQFSNIILPHVSGMQFDTSRLLVDGTLSVAAIPEPSAFVLAGLALLGLACFGRRVRRR